MNKLHLSLIVLLTTIILISSSVFTVDQRQKAIIFQFGEAIRIIEEPGLKFKIPFMQNVHFLDKRLLNVNVEAKELTASDGKRIIVDALAKFKIIDSVKFYKTVYDKRGVSLRLNRILESSMRKVIGKFPLSTLLTEKRSTLMKLIADLVYKESLAFGITIMDVRILKADLPSANSAAIYRNMQTQREKEARQIRAEGSEEAARIRSKADKESQIILAEAYMQSEKLKGMGDAEATKIYNNSYSKDRNFYYFYRSLAAYKHVLRKDDTSFYLSPKSDFLKYLDI